jgi:hypothetical protein
VARRFAGRIRRLPRRRSGARRFPLRRLARCSRQSLQSRSATPVSPACSHRSRRSPVGGGLCKTAPSVGDDFVLLWLIADNKARRLDEAASATLRLWQGLPRLRSVRPHIGAMHEGRDGSPKFVFDLMELYCPEDRRFGKARAGQGSWPRRLTIPRSGIRPNEADQSAAAQPRGSPIVLGAVATTPSERANLRPRRLRAVASVSYPAAASTAGNPSVSTWPGWRCITLLRVGFLLYIRSIDKR